MRPALQISLLGVRKLTESTGGTSAATGVQRITRRRTDISFLAWVVLGLLAGFIGSKLVNKRGEGIGFDILLGIVGAVGGGILFNARGARVVSGFDLYSLIIAVVGSVLFLSIYHVMFRRA